ncbi:MAG: thioredoxin family protein [Bacteroidia bacterium]
MIKEAIEKGISYSEYRRLVDDLLSRNLTTGLKQTSALVEFTKLNVQRMNRIDKTFSVSTDITDRLNRIEFAQVWLLIAEAWCGDCAQNIPIIAKIAEQGSDKITLKIVGRDQLPDLMDKYLTNGARSIPKLIVLDSSSLSEIGTWGPRPKAAQQIMLNWKANKDTMSWEDFEKELHLWYARDKGNTLSNEMYDMLLKTRIVNVLMNRNLMKI